MFNFPNCTISLIFQKATLTADLSQSVQSAPNVPDARQNEQGAVTDESEVDCYVTVVGHVNILYPQHIFLSTVSKCK